MFALYIALLKNNHGVSYSDATFEDQGDILIKEYEPEF
jgi:hypothetical protein